MSSRNVSKADMKVVLLGDANVGKTSLVLRYIDRRFQDTVSTIGASFLLKRWGYYNIAIWDTAGEEIYSGLSNFYCRNAAAAILVFDLTARSTFETLRQRYIPLLDSVNGAKLKIVVGTKRDLLRTTKRQINVDEGKELARSLNPHIDGEDVVTYYETSSKTGYNVDEMFEYVFQHFYPNGGSEPRPVINEDAGFLLSGTTSVVKEKVPVSCCR